MRIKVGRRHINAGTRVGAFSCPIALAVQEALNAPAVGVAAGTVVMYSRSLDHRLGPGEKTATYRLPQFAWDWYLQYDEGAVVWPFEFKMERMNEPDPS